VIDISHLPNRGETVFVNPSDLTGRHFHQGVARLDVRQRCLLTGAARNLATATRGQFNIVNVRAGGNGTQRQRISRENDLLARLDGSRLMIRQLAHEIKNPLGGLRGAAQLLERELQEAALKEYTRVIIGEADRLTALVDSMAGPSRAPQKVHINVHEICEHVYHLLRAEARNAVVIERDYDPSLPDSILDRHQTIQALLNVARNALQAVGDSGQITIRTRALTNVSIGPARHKLVASVEVEDSGPGVPDELRSSIFYPLVTGRANGTGLGLAVAQELVTRNGGLIEFESEPKRTIFTLLLPLGES